MVGIELNSLTESLIRVPAHLRTKPVLSIKDPERKLGHWHQKMLENNEHFSFYKDFYRLPLAALKGFTFDERCKMYCSAFISPESSVEQLFEEDSRYEVVRKIQNSQRRWGRKGECWNQIVDAHHSMRFFDLDLDGFTVTLDHTRSTNRRSDAKYSGTFLDGVFGYLVHYRGQHVMTIGFSISTRRRLLLQQLQMVRPKGNRFLYRRPVNRLEFIIERFRIHFPRFSLWIVDVRTMLTCYRKQYESARNECTYKLNERVHAIDEEKASLRAEKARLTEHIQHFRQDEPRLVRFYNDLGRFTRTSECFESNGIMHHEIA